MVVDEIQAQSLKDLQQCARLSHSVPRNSTKLFPHTFLHWPCSGMECSPYMDIHTQVIWLLCNSAAMSNLWVLGPISLFGHYPSMGGVHWYQLCDPGTSPTTIERPIVCSSQTLRSEKNYSHLVKEGLACVLASRSTTTMSSDDVSSW